MKFQLLERKKPEVSSGVSSAHVIKMGRGNEKVTVRKIGYYDSETYKPYIFLTNNFTLPAKIMADLYKARQQIEVFFKEIKLFLEIKKFVGTNENAVKIQIYIALTVYLLLAQQKFLSKVVMSVEQLFQLIQLNLVGLRNIADLLLQKPDRQKKFLC